jgi:hypothetical protein
MKLSKEILAIKITINEQTLIIKQNTIDPCVFQVCDTHEGGNVRGILLTHVDDIMLMTEKDLVEPIQKALQEKFPVEEWVADEFEYVGCEYKCTPTEIHITQKHYTAGRVDKVTAKALPDGSTSREQIEENRTSIGSLSWLAKQTRPDLQFCVSQAQKRQNNPSQDDIKKTNKAVDAALAFQDKGIVLRYVAEKEIAFVTFHDAAWANVSEEGSENDLQWLGDHQLRSQLGSLVLVTSKQAFIEGKSDFSIIDWKSKGSTRVCRSTFAGETMACCEGVESALFLRCLFLSFARGIPISEDDSGRFAPLHCVTDCRSLYDHLHREGVPKAPAEKRLAIDLAGLRQILMREAKHQWHEKYGTVGDPTPDKPCRPPLHWMPTHLQLGDILTKEMHAGNWWQLISLGCFDFPFRNPAEPTQEAGIL